MAYITVTELATRLHIPLKKFNQLLEKLQDEGLFSSYYEIGDGGEIMDEDDQEVFLSNLEHELDNQHQINNNETLDKQTKMSEELFETKSKLDLLYQYEKHYLELIKEYKEEIKFASSLQEDLRRERSQFFTQTLREVVQTLQAQEIDKKVASQWIEELVASYTKSIDLSSDLAKTHVVQVLSIFKEEAKQEVSKAKLDNLGANSSKVDAE